MILFHKLILILTDRPSNGNLATIAHNFLYTKLITIKSLKLNSGHHILIPTAVVVSELL